jgi:hypothetical protein
MNPSRLSGLADVIMQVQRVAKIAAILASGAKLPVHPPFAQLMCTAFLTPRVIGKASQKGTKRRGKMSS